MTKLELKNLVALAKEQTRDALQLVYDTLNHGQQQKLLRNEEVKRLFDLYGIETE